MKVLNFKTGNNENSKFFHKLSREQKLKILSNLGGEYFAEYVKKMENLNTLIQSITFGDK